MYVLTYVRHNTITIFENIFKMVDYLTIKCTVINSSRINYYLHERVNICEIRRSKSFRIELLIVYRGG